MLQSYIALVESFNYAVILVEDRAEFLLKTYGPQLEAKWNSSSQPQSVVAGVEGQPGETLPAKIMTYILSFDPTKKRQYAQWLVTRYLKDGLRLEDLEAAKENLTVYTQMKAANTLAPDKKDVNTFKTMADLAGAIRTTQHVAQSAEAGEEASVLQQSKVLYDGADMRILIPETEDAACYFGRDTEWCTAWGSEKGRYPARTNRFDDYARQGPLFIIQLKPDGTLYQYHSKTTQFMDVNDRQLSTEATKALLKAHPKIMPVIGEDSFINSHLRQFGLSFFSPKGLLKANPLTLIDAIHNEADFAAVPETLRKEPTFLATFLARKTTLASKLISPELLTPEMALELRKLTTKWQAFELFPMKEWSEEAVEGATNDGHLTYEQYMNLPDDQRSPAQLKKLISVTASKNPAAIATYPPGLIGKLGAAEEIVKRNIRVLESLSAVDLPEAQLVKIAEAGTFQSEDLKYLAYVEPERVTDAVVAAVNQRESNDWYRLKPGEDMQGKLRKLWSTEFFRSSSDGLVRTMEKLPRRYREDPTFFEAILAIGVSDNRTHPREGRNDWLRMFLNAIKGVVPITSNMLEALVDGIVIKYSSDNYSANNTIKSFRDILLATDKSQWTGKFIKTALTRKLLKPEDVPEDKITPDVAARLFAVDPTQIHHAHAADDESLIGELEKDHYSSHHLSKHIPDERFTEPLAFTAVSKSAVPNAKKRFPKAALSKRVYFAGVPYSFSLKEVPKAARTDALVVKAVSKDAGQLKYLSEPLRWLNAHKEELETLVDPHWKVNIERFGIVQTNAGFEHIADLPSDDIEGGYTLFKAVVGKKKEQRWFLRKGAATVCIMTIRNGKLQLMNEHPAKELAPALRDIAKRFLDKVNDISVLNRVGVYRKTDGTIRDNDDALPKTSVEGIDWTESPHLKGKMFTAWKDTTALIKIYVAIAGGWSYKRKIQNVDVLDAAACMANVKALIAGIDKIARQPENGTWVLRDIGIGWNKHMGYFQMTETKMGKTGSYRAYYNAGNRVISIFKGDKGLAASAVLFKNGKLGSEHVSYKFEDDNKLLKAALRVVAEKIIAKER